MPDIARPFISAGVAAYQAEEWIGEALESILGQTRPPDEVVVVDDGSTDGTARELARFGDRIRVLRQPNAGYQDAMNRVFREARGGWVAMCGADDIWEPRKLEWQEEAILAHPEVDVFVGHAILFGRVEAPHSRPSGEGVLDGPTLATELFSENIISTPTVTMRRSLFDRVGPFLKFEGDDYDYWFRCLRAGVKFYYDPRPMLRYRRHESNLTNDTLSLFRAMNLVHQWHVDLVDDRAVIRAVLADEHFRIGRLLVDAGEPRAARAAFATSLRHWRGMNPFSNARAVAWLAVLSLPAGVRARVGRVMVDLRHAVGAEAS